MATRRLGGITTSSSVPDNGGDHSGGGGGAGGYVDDVFSTYVYEGTGAARDIENGIDLAGEGGMVWLKQRSGTRQPAIVDTERGAQVLYTDGANAGSDGYVSSFGPFTFSSDGFNTGSAPVFNEQAENHTSWTFRKAPNFFDVVTYTGTSDQDSVPANQSIPHNLGIAPGMIIVKCTSAASTNWMVYHSDLNGGTNPEQHSLMLNMTDAERRSSADWADTAPTDTHFTVGHNNRVNGLGEEFVAYVFAHDDSDESMIKCGSYTGNGTLDGPEIDLGFEPQWILLKGTSSGAAYNWRVHDMMRGWTADGTGAKIEPDTSDAEDPNECRLSLLPNGFKPISNAAVVNGADKNYIYVAIRRPNKPAEEFEPEDLFANTQYNGTGTEALSKAKSGFPVDLAMHFQRIDGPIYQYTSARLAAGKSLVTNSNAAEVSETQVWDVMDGVQLNNQGNEYKRLQCMWRRAPEFMDVVTYSSSGQVGAEIPHNLTVPPEMIWVKMRTGGYSWNVYHSALTASKYLRLNTDGPLVDDTESWYGVEPTESVFTLGDDGAVNLAGSNYIAYLFASVPGTCDIGSYDGSDQAVTVDCGFSTGPRFILIKCVTTNGDWAMWDSLLSLIHISEPTRPY